MEIKDGDIFFWVFKKFPESREPYWARSQYAIASQGVLRDTYWSGCCDGFSLSYEKALDTLNLQFLGNLSELENKPEYLADYYDDKDCVNINHRNSTRGNFYIRKGAKRSKAKMIETAYRLIEREESNIRVAQSRIAQLNHSLNEISLGLKKLDDIYI